MGPRPNSASIDGRSCASQRGRERRVAIASEDRGLARAAREHAGAGLEAARGGLLSCGRSVVSYDRQHFYLTVSHYGGFSYRDGGQIVSRLPFYEIVPAGTLLAALPKPPS